MNARLKIVEFVERKLNNERNRLKEYADNGGETGVYLHGKIAALEELLNEFEKLS